MDARQAHDLVGWAGDPRWTGRRRGRTPSTVPTASTARPPAGRPLQRPRPTARPARSSPAPLARLARENGLTHVVDVGAGRGELLSHVYAADPALRLTGVDVVAEAAVAADRRSSGSSPRAERPCRTTLRDLDDALVVAHEWLDVVPCPVAEVDDDGDLRRVLVDPAHRRGVPRRPGRRRRPRLGHRALAEPTAAATGSRSGLPRDRAWADLVEPGRPGCRSSPWTTATAAVTGPRTARSRHTGAGSRSTPCRTAPATSPPTSRWTPSTTTSCSTSAPRCAGSASTVGTPPLELASRDPQAYLQALAASSAAAALAAPGGFGDFLWAVKRVG